MAEESSLAAVEKVNTSSAESVAKHKQLQELLALQVMCTCKSHPATAAVTLSACLTHRVGRAYRVDKQKATGNMVVHLSTIANQFSVMKISSGGVSGCSCHTPCGPQPFTHGVHGLCRSGRAADQLEKGV